MTIRLDWDKLFQLKKRWGASIQAIVRRAYDLGLITAVQYRNAYVYISRKGWKRGEPPSTEPQPEPIEILPTAFELLKQHRGMTAEKLANNLHIKCSIFEKFEIPCSNVEPVTIARKAVSVKEHPLKHIKININ